LWKKALTNDEVVINHEGRYLPVTRFHGLLPGLKSTSQQLNFTPTTSKRRLLSRHKQPFLRLIRLTFYTLFVPAYHRSSTPLVPPSHDRFRIASAEEPLYLAFLCHIYKQIHQYRQSTSPTFTSSSSIASCGEALYTLFYLKQLLAISSHALFRSTLPSHLRPPPLPSYTLDHYRPAFLIRTIAYLY
jgi:hypothetical protein